MITVAQVAAEQALQDMAYTPRWKKSFALFPKKCSASNKRIWLEFAWKGVYYKITRFEVIEKVRWETNEAHTIRLLKETTK